MLPMECRNLGADDVDGCVLNFRKNFRKHGAVWESLVAKEEEPVYVLKSTFESAEANRNDLVFDLGIEVVEILFG